MRLVRLSQLERIPASHENSAAPGVWKQVYLRRNDLAPGRIQMVNWASLPAGNSFRSHYHEDMTEVFIIISGEVQMTVNNEGLSLSPGDAIVVEPGEVHQMTNLQTTEANYIVFGVATEQGGKTVCV